MSGDDLLIRRLETLENAARRLLAEAADIRRELDQPAAAPPPAPPRPPPEVRKPPRPAPDAPGFEQLVGRYGAMGLAALALISAVGIFLRWAIERGLLGPEVRVFAGFIAACALAAIGARFRARGARSFGNTLVAIALALIHVDAWAAGPLLQVVPNSVALGVAAVASIALAALALRAGDQLLFIVGTGGALIAPFVASAGRGDGVSLLVYGLVVLTTAVGGIRERPWVSARWLLAVGCFVYAGAAMTAGWSIPGRWGKEAPAIFAVVCAWGALVSGARIHGPRLVQSYIAASLPPLFYVFDQEALFGTHLAIAAVATVTLWVSVHLHEETGDRWSPAVLVLPLLLLLAALLPMADAFTLVGAIVALAWATGAAVAGHLAGGRRREVHWTVGSVAVGIAMVLWLHDREVPLTWALSALGAAVALLIRRERAPLLILPAVLALLGATYLTTIEFAVRAPYAYVPFATLASLAALGVVGGAWTFGWAVANTKWRGWAIAGRERSVIASLGLIAAFLWVRAELAEAWSADIATFLLIGYYALTGVTAIFVGRARKLDDLRRVGLGIAIYAALKAIMQAYGLTAVGLRVGSFLLVGCFLLAVAYWYRDAGDRSTLRADAG